MSYIGNTVENQNYVPAIDYFNGDGSTVAFTLSRPVASVAAVQAVISNVPQNPGSAFTVSGSTITFTSAPPSGTNNIYVYYTSPNTQVVQPGQGTVGTTQLATDLTLTNPTYTGTLTGGTGVVNIGSGQVYKDSSGNVGIGTSSPSFGSGSGLELLRSGTATFRLNSNSQGVEYRNNAGTAEIDTRGAFPIVLMTNQIERMRIDSSGNLLVGTTSQFTTGGWTPKFTMDSGGDGVAIINVNSGYATQITKASAAHTYYAGQYLNSSGTSVGKITVSTTGTTYVTTSDYRLKDNVKPMIGALNKVLQLNPVTYTWKEDGTEGQGFIAHELQAVVPDCVVGEKDGVDRNGNPDYQGIDTSFLVATLTKAIQEQQAQIETLTAKVAALEAK